MPRPSQTPEAHREERVSGCAPTTGCPTLRAMAKTTRPATRTQKARAHEPTVAGPTFESEHLERLADEGAAAWTKILRDRRDPHRRHAGEARPASSIGGHGMGAPDGPRGSTATDPPWARLPSESSRAFSCFQTLSRLRPPRPQCGKGCGKGVLADDPPVQERGWTISADDLRRKLKEGGLLSEFMNSATPEPDVATAESRHDSWSWSTENEPET